jgi:hypothetical protein
MIRLLVSGIARTFAEAPSRDTAAPVSTGPIPLSDAQIDQVSGGGAGQSFSSTIVSGAREDFIPPNPIIPNEPIRPVIGRTISTAAKGTTT